MLSGIPVEMSCYHNADLASRMIVLAGRLLNKVSPTCEILDIQLFTGLWSTEATLETRQSVLSPLARLLFEAPAWEMR